MRLLVFKFGSIKITNLTTAHIIILSLMKENNISDGCTGPQLSAVHWSSSMHSLALSNQNMISKAEKTVIREISKKKQKKRSFYFKHVIRTRVTIVTLGTVTSFG